MVKPKLTIVGGGPGDEDLITLKAIKAIKNADVILYDALINKALLKYALESTELIYVGKRKGCYQYQQDQINELIVYNAKSHGHVVRLKGGDPFIFGRGAEELEYAQQHGLETHFIPGISSSIAVPALQGIPLTRRGVAESFWIITGTTKNHQISKDISIAAQSSATVVILMGMSKLYEIISIYSSFGKQNTPIAIIQNGSLPEEKIGIGKISSIASIVSKKQLGSPAIIVIGAVVEHRVQLNNISLNVRKQLNPIFS